VAASRWLVVELAGRDLDHLAYAWLNDVISASEVEHRGVIAAEVTSIERPEGDEETDPWRLHARVGLGGFDDRVRALRHAKGASLHGLHVRERAGRWTMEALLDL
jgi:SHS2 domain-containing protein